MLIVEFAIFQSAYIPMGNLPEIQFQLLSNVYLGNQER